MVEVQLSERARKIWNWLAVCKGETAIRQQSLADDFGCSRRSIGRALKELKEAGLLIDLNKRHENRCKMYRVPASSLLRSAGNDELTPQAANQLKLYRYTFEANFRDWPDWEKYYPQVSRELEHITDIHVLFRKSFDKLYEKRRSFLLVE